MSKCRSRLVIFVGLVAIAMVITPLVQGSSVWVYFHSGYPRTDLSLFATTGSEYVYDQSDIAQPTGNPTSVSLTARIPASSLGTVGISLPSSAQGAYLAYASWILRVPSVSVDGDVRIDVWMSSSDTPGMGSAYFFAIADVNPQNLHDSFYSLWSDANGGLGNVLSSQPAMKSTSDFGRSFRISNHPFAPGRALMFIAGAGALKEGWQFKVYFDGAGMASHAEVPAALLQSTTTSTFSTTSSFTSASSTSQTSTSTTTQIQTSTTATSTTSSSATSSTVASRTTTTMQSSASQSQGCAISVSLTATPTSGSAPLTATLSAIVTGASGAVQYDWWFGDGSHITGKQIETYTYQNPWTYNVVVKVTDFKGCWSQASTNVNVAPQTEVSSNTASVSSVCSQSVNYKIPFQDMKLRYYSETTPILLQTAGLSANGWITLTFHGLCSSDAGMDILLDGNAIQNGQQVPIQSSQSADLPTDRDTLVYLRNGGQNNLTIFAGPELSTIPLLPGYSIDLTRQWDLWDKPILRTNLTTQGSFSTYRYHTVLKSVPSQGGNVDLDFYASYEVTTQVLVYGEVWATQNGRTTLIEKITLRETNVPFAAPQSQCIIATAAYGSELAGSVQFLRDFRDKEVLSTSEGRAFMQAFNGWYYSWAPPVAQVISGNELLKAAVRGFIGPLIGALFASHGVFRILVGLNPDVAIVAAGITASALIGVIYMTLPMYCILRFARRRVNRITLFWLVGIGLIITPFGTVLNRTMAIPPNILACAMVEVLLLTPALLLGMISEMTAKRA